ATYVDRYGMLKSVAADIPRFTADGLLIEGASTNLLTYSEQFDNGAWVKTNTSITTNTAAVTDPFGTNLASKIIETSNLSSKYILQNVSFVSGATYTKSLYAKAGERSKIMLRLYSGAFMSNQEAIFDLVAGTATVKSGNPAISIQQLLNGWYRCSISATATSSLTTLGFVLFITDNSGGINYTGDGTSGLYIFGAQLEAMPFATSYIPTTTASLSRAADVCSFPISDNMVKLQQSSGHTFMADVRLEGRFASMDQIALGGDTTGTRHALGFYSLAMFSHNAKGGGLNIIGDIDMLLKRRYGVVYNGSASHMYIDGLFKGSVSSASTSENTSVMLIGSASGGRYLFGTISNLRIYDRALTAEEVRLA
ncbi:phage head spike fiber domain-containing protein, partial [Seleniivibrio woodruffii]|uniref:phage head spike fiber domain-containing protein n=1 Tax=Seleniivibrio woodruffii TaxID=1078050 RepID=UPI0039E67492